jgi:oligopeptide/dipeptide ABC transporter ATP-binding protein
LPQVQLSPSPTSDDAGTGSNPLLSVNDLSVTFRKSRGSIIRTQVEIRAVDRVTFEIRESEIVSLVGESGSGKTTVARSVMGLQGASQGSIRYRGAEVLGRKGSSVRDYWREVQMIYQDPFESLDPGRSVQSTISASIRNLTGERDKEAIRRKAITLLEEMELDPSEVLNKYPHQLSGGQRQRVNIARALASDPKLILADEPITMLDAAQKMNILRLLRRLQSKRRLSILLVTHDLASARVMSQRILVMYLGRLVEVGATETVMSSPHHPYVELILQSTPRLKRSSEVQAEGGQAFSSIEQSEEVTKGCAFQTRCRYSTSVCQTTEPELTEKSSDHSAACHNPLNVS